ncbi:glycolate oxidase subunit GlcE [Rhodoferax sp.]|uniref:glycolate oxidase subunit GlcE n=1 Tax=Rhodoferax sp. TaxID=50421 RepID=UPI002ACE3C2F|nr:glycolate oxidase subunit GlcE [Rhodoferax sp.]MDZ7922378.1 glycolate oxidase subunit GlcE [Rhodoferax sp.]
MHVAPSIQTLLDQVRTAMAERTPLQIRGGGSKDFVGTIQPAQLLDTRSHSGILDYAPSELVVTVAAGTPLAELEAALAEKGQCLPFEPPHFMWSAAAGAPAIATVGGMVATGLAGPARATVGSVRDYVLGLQLINGQGEHLTFGGQVMKNVAGYDVSRLMAGAMGTLGVITQVSLKVLPMAPAEATLVFAVDQANALEHLHRWGGQPLPLNASCWVHDDTAPGGGRDLLFVRLRGAVAAVEAACQKMLAELPGEPMDNAQAGPDWALCRDQRLPFFADARAPELALWRLSVAPTAPVLDLPWAQMVEWQGGLRWLWAPQQAGAQLQAAARAAGGNAIVFVAARADSTRAGCQFDTKNAARDAITRRLKAAFDPLGLFNPGRLCADL